MAAAIIGTSVTPPRTSRVCSVFRSRAATAGQASAAGPLRGLSGNASVSMEATPAAARSFMELAPGRPLTRTPVCPGGGDHRPVDVRRQRLVAGDPVHLRVDLAPHFANSRRGVGRVEEPAVGAGALVDAAPGCPQARRQNLARDRSVALCHAPACPRVDHAEACHAVGQAHEVEVVGLEIGGGGCPRVRVDEARHEHRAGGRHAHGAAWKRCRRLRRHALDPAALDVDSRRRQVAAPGHVEHPRALHQHRRLRGGLLGGEDGAYGNRSRSDAARM